MTTRIRVGDCRDVLPTLLEGEVDSVVTDTPYHLTGATRFGETRSTRGFMNKTWDGGDVSFRPETWEVVARVVRPGGYLLAFGGTRTWHRLACAIEDGGWEIIDTLAWLYGQGFPKHDSKLKPAFEPIILARTDGPVHPLSIDGCRIPATDADYARNASGDRGHAGTREHGEVTDMRMGGGSASALGRWPANVVLDEDAAAALDEQSGELRSNSGNLTHRNGVRGAVYGAPVPGPTQGRTDRGGASRFFYCAKASRAERDAGLDDLEKKPLHWSSGDKNPGAFQSPGTEKAARNHHPTVKPIALMRWLVRLVTPAGGTVLDPFMGSGSTGCACGLEGFRFIGTDLDAEYVEIARRRIIHWRKDELFAGGAV